MELWTLWTHTLETALGYMTAHFGFSEAVAIIVLTLIGRAVLTPVSLAAAYKMQKNKEAIERIKPRLEELRRSLKNNPSELAARTIALYRESGITLIDKTWMFNFGLQGVFGLGFYQCLKRLVFSSKFLWIANLAKPDLLLTAIVTALMVLGMTAMPGVVPDTSMLLMVVISVLVSVAAIAALPSTIGIYWATSNAVTAAQTLVLRGLLARKRRATKPS